MCQPCIWPIQKDYLSYNWRRKSPVRFCNLSSEIGKNWRAIKCFWHAISKNTQLFTKCLLETKIHIILMNLIFLYFPSFMDPGKYGHKQFCPFLAINSKTPKLAHGGLLIRVDAWTGSYTLINSYRQDFLSKKLTFEYLHNLLSVDISAHSLLRNHFGPQPGLWVLGLCVCGRGEQPYYS